MSELDQEQLQLIGWEHRMLAQLLAGQRISGVEPDPEDLAWGPKILCGQATADEVIRERLVQIEAKYGISRAD